MFISAVRGCIGSFTKDGNTSGSGDRQTKLDGLTKFVDVFLLNSHPMLLLCLLQPLNNFRPSVVP